eukprot:6237689-Prymnesium_polylepis.2
MAHPFPNMASDGIVPAKPNEKDLQVPNTRRAAAKCARGHQLHVRHARRAGDWADDWADD